MFDLYTDSCCDLPSQLVDKEKIYLIKNVVTIDGKEYEDDLGVTFNYPYFYQSMAEKKEAHTSQINAYTFYQSFLPSVQAGRPVVYVAFSSILGGGSWGNMHQAKNELLEKYPQAKIYLIDSKSASLGLGLLVLQAVQMKKAKITVEETVRELNDKADHIQHYVTVNDLKHLQRGGRVSASSAAVGTLMKINPVLYVDFEGKLQTVAKLRGRKKALEFLVDKAIGEYDSASNMSIGVVHADSLADAQFVKEEILKGIPQANVLIGMIGPTIGTHVGRGGIAVVYIGKNKRPIITD